MKKNNKFDIGTQKTHKYVVRQWLEPQLVILKVKIINLAHY